jgi:hypothetical protein
MGAMAGFAVVSEAGVYTSGKISREKMSVKCMKSYATFASMINASIKPALRLSAASIVFCMFTISKFKKGYISRTNWAVIVPSKKPTRRLLRSVSLIYLL